MYVQVQNTTFCSIFTINDPFPIKLSWMVYHHKLECLVKISDCSVQGQGHSCFNIFILLSIEPFVSRLDVHECVLCEKSGMYGHGHSKGLLLIRVYDCFYYLVF